MRRTASLIATLLLIAAACGEEQGGEPTSSPSTTMPASTTMPTPTTMATSTTTEPAATTTEPSPPVAARVEIRGLFTSGDGPIIPHGPDGAWDGQYTDPGAAAYVDGTIHVLQNGFVGWPAAVGVGHWRSDDGGATWQEVSDDPVLDGTAVDFAGVTALASSLVVEDDGTWVLFFYTWDDSSWPLSRSTIGRATAPGPDGPWTIDPEPVLVPGEEGSWDDHAVRVPSVVKTDDGYLMWFTGASETLASIGLAASPDGVVWTKHDDPATTAPPYRSSDPVLVPGTTAEGNVWDQNNVHQPRVVQTEEGFVMLYASVNTVSTPGSVNQKHGLAVSADGVEWARSTLAQFSPGDFEGAQAIWFTELLRIEDRLLAFVEVGTGNETAVYLLEAAIADLPSPP